ncbi:conserved hypothetical protein [Chthoniobacter flavus Ellin428]|uniref:DUF1501 domain-containing protein n=1 Tax=Chthoniobacter flavus Ellin428 TaxID=497964 RepID=B4CWM7_9BACT|nr:conserved hypothetical protein [Chthoniobacter flavus Ellin428]
MSPIRHNCAGVSRRDFLQIGLGGTLGLGLCDLLRARAAAAPTTPAAKNVNCIMIWMDGGPSHYETFDPQARMPRRKFAALSAPCPTCVPGGAFQRDPFPNLAQVFR